MWYDILIYDILTVHKSLFQEVIKSLPIIYQNNATMSQKVGITLFL